MTVRGNPCIDRAKIRRILGKRFDTLVWVYLIIFNEVWFCLLLFFNHRLDDNETLHTAVKVKMAASKETASKEQHQNFKNFDDFRVNLDSGDFGNKVMVGRNLETNETVAVKVLGWSGGSKEDREAAERKARRDEDMHNHMVANGFRHRNLVTVYTVTSIGCAVYIAMELANLGNLSQYFKRHDELCTNEDLKSLRVKVGFAEDMAGGLTYLHDQNIVHLDLKPDNVVVSDANVAKICDFGLMKKLDPECGESSDHELLSDMGCRPFQAPEFFTHPVRYGFKSDVFPLGLICAAMIQAVPNVLQPLAESDPVIGIIGLAALTDPGLVVLEKREDDGQLLKEFKDLIRTMLTVSTEDRVSSANAQAQLESLLEVLNHNHVSFSFCLL